MAGEICRAPFHSAFCIPALLVGGRLYLYNGLSAFSPAHLQLRALNLQSSQLNAALHLEGWQSSLFQCLNVMALLALHQACATGLCGITAHRLLLMRRVRHCYLCWLAGHALEAAGQCGLTIIGMCPQHGQVLQLLIPRPSPPGQPQMPGVGKVIIQFGDISSAARARQAMNGRKFAGRTVTGTFLSEEQFATGQFD